MTLSETKLFTIRETAQILKVSIPTIYRLMRRGELHWHDIGDLRRVSQIQIDEYLEKNQNGQQTDI